MNAQNNVQAHRVLETVCAPYPGKAKRHFNMEHQVEFTKGYYLSQGLNYT